MTENKKSMKKKIEETSKKISKRKSSKQSKEYRIKELENQVEELKIDVLRARADYDNLMKRTGQEKLEIKDKVIVDFVSDLLPAIDNFETSLKMTDNKEMFVKGVEMIHKNLIDTLKEHKIEEFSAKKGDTFDPSLHEPIPVEDNSKDLGKIVAIVKKGFKHKEKIIRPVRVQIPKKE